jgi:hypothetical protein
VNASDYYPFGMSMPGRSYNFTNYRYGFGSQEKSYKIDAGGNSVSAEFWQFDTRIGRRWNVDPLANEAPGWTPYRGFYNNPIRYADPNGAKEYESREAFEKANPGKKWDKDRGQGDWLKADREWNSGTWQSANKYNLQQKEGYKEYTTIEQRAGFYGWYAAVEDLRGGETKWSGAAWVIAKQMSLVDLLFTDLMVVLGKDNAGDLNKFANAGNKAIFDDVFANLRDNMNGPPKKGADARKWDETTLRREQFDIVQPIYETWVKKNPKLKNILQDMASQKSIFGLMGFPRELKFEGNIMSAQDRYNHGMNKAVPYAEQKKKEGRALDEEIMKRKNKKG